MIYLYIRQTVGDVKLWKEAFDIHFSARQAGGATQDAFVLRDVNDPCKIILLLGWCDLAQAQTFISSVSWQMLLKQMGITGSIEVCFLEDVG